jgi:putative serine/threonine protein kinase
MESKRSPPTPSERVSLEGLTRTPFLQVLTYPRIDMRAAKSRVKELKELGVDELVFEGRTRIGRLGILGLGTVGVVVKASAAGRLCAVKIRRTDANRPSMKDEVRITVLANRVGIGPEVYGHSKDMMLMKLLESTEISDWLKGLSGPGTRDEVRRMVHSLLNQCRKLDILGVDHGQLSNLRKHAVIAEGVPWIIDFESAGTQRKPRNVTTAAQYLLVGGAVSPRLRRMLGVRETSALTTLLGEYKRDLSDYSYSKLLEYLKLA